MSTPLAARLTVAPVMRPCSIRQSWRRVKGQRSPGQQFERVWSGNESVCQIRCWTTEKTGSKLKLNPRFQLCSPWVISVLLIPRLHDEASSTSWLELASSCKHYANLASRASFMKHSRSIHEAGFIIKLARRASSSS